MFKQISILTGIMLGFSQKTLPDFNFQQSRNVYFRWCAENNRSAKWRLFMTESIRSKEHVFKWTFSYKLHQLRIFLTPLEFECLSHR
jgi:hypothetical protein